MLRINSRSSRVNKAISSEDFKQNSDDDYKEKFAKFSGATAISSADFFADESEENKAETSIKGFDRDSFGDKMSEAAIYAADRVTEQAKILKQKATNFWSSLRTSDPSRS